MFYSSSVVSSAELERKLSLSVFDSRHMLLLVSSEKKLASASLKAPIFVLNGVDCDVECTTAFVTGDRPDHDLSYKVVSAVRKKAESGSHRSNCALFIDITNLLHASLAATSDALLSDTRAALLATKFFSVILFAHVFNSDLKRLETIYFREDNDGLEDDQRNFLDTHYPIVGDRAYEFYFPRSG